MDIKRNGSQPSGEGPADYFTGGDPLVVVLTQAVSDSQLAALREDGAVQVWTRTPPLRGVSGGGRSWQPSLGPRARWLAAMSAALLLRHL
jgi:hypothetical protein